MQYCRNCGKEYEYAPAICAVCGASPGAGTHYCPQCGAVTNPNQAACVKCGAALFAPSVMNQTPLKSRLAAGLLGVFAGGFGVHRFYLGYINIGVIQLVLTLLSCGIGGVWGFIEGIMILTGGIDRDAQGRPLRD